MKFNPRVTKINFTDMAAKNACWSLLFFAVVGISLNAYAAANEQLVVNVDYESRALNVDAYGVVADKPSAADSIVVDCTIARRGQCSEKTTLQQSAQYISFGNYRAESSTLASKLSWYKPGDAFRYRFSLYLPDDWERDAPASVDIVWQFKHFSDRADAFVAIKGGNVVLRIGPKEQVVLIKNYPLGTWMDFQFDIRWSGKQDGQLVAATRVGSSSDYVEVVRRHGQNIWGSPSNNGYIKWGLYKPAYKNSVTHRPRIVYHDEISVVRLNPDFFQK